MEAPHERLIELSARLQSATETRNLEWSAEEDTAFLWKGRSGAVEIRSRDGDGDHPFVLTIFSQGMQKVETLTSEWGEDEEPAAWNDALGRLYRAARREALGVDKILDDLFAELPRAKEPAPAPPPGAPAS